MKLGKVLTYNDVDEAMELIGKKVIHSDNFKEIGTKEDILASIWGRPTILTGVNDGPSALYPFSLEGNSRSQFIREVMEDEPEEPRYEPYDLSDKKVRDSLRGRWYKWEGPDGIGEEMVTRFLLSPCTKKWEINGWDGEWFLKHCHWIDDGTPCGKLMNMEDEDD